MYYWSLMYVVFSGDGRGADGAGSWAWNCSLSWSYGYDWWGRNVWWGGGGYCMDICPTGGRWDVDSRDSPCQAGGGTSEGRGAGGARMTISLPAIMGCLVSVETTRRRLKNLVLKHLVILDGFKINISTKQITTRKRMIKGMRRNIAQSFPPDFLPQPV